MKCRDLTIAFIILISPLSAPAQTKLDPFFSTPSFEKTPPVIPAKLVPACGKRGAGISSDFRLPIGVGGKLYGNDSNITVFIHSLNPAHTSSAIKNSGGEVRLIAGDILTAALPAEALQAIAGRGEVTYLEAAKPLTLLNDIAIPEINAAEVHQGIQLEQGVTGKNTIIGIVDTGIDLGHPDFLDAAGTPRIIAVWDQLTAGVSPQEFPNSYGTECRQEDIAAGRCDMHDAAGHGTHIAGIAAGRHERYGGVAPDAQLIAVRYRSEVELKGGYVEPLFSTQICEAVAYIFKKAEGLNMPAVVNLSLGTHLGAHDGTSLFEQCLDQLVLEKPGRAIVAAAGNETLVDPNYTGLHASLDVAGGMRAANFVVRDHTQSRFAHVDIWGQTGNQLRVGLALHRGAPGKESRVAMSDLIALGGETAGKFLNDLISYHINAKEVVNPLNQKPHIGIGITFDPAFKNPKDYSFDLIVEGHGHVEAWLYPDKPLTAISFTTVEGDRGQPWMYVAGDRRMNIAIPATATNVIAVGGYATRNRWKKTAGCCETNFKVGKLLEFSSVGPSAAPERVGVKPEITAPGAMIASALSGDAIVEKMLVTPDGQHMLQAGTSMAAPYVAGAVALLFSINPQFTAADVEALLTGSAYADEEVGEVPNDAWGYGKLDVYAAVEKAMETPASSPSLASASPTKDAGGSAGGCAIVPTVAPSNTSAAVWLILPFTVFFLRRAIFRRSFRDAHWAFHSG